MIRKMLVAVELDAPSADVVAGAGALARQLEAEVTLVRVSIPPVIRVRTSARHLGMSVRELDERAREAERDQLRALADEHLAPERSPEIVQLADRRPHRAIVRLAEERKVDLIVVGGAQRTWPKTWLLGPATSAQVAHDARRPVLVLPDRHRALPPGGRILAATRPGDAVVDAAAELAAQLDASLTVLHTISLAERAPVNRLARMLGGHAEHHEAVRRQLLERIASNPATKVDDVVVEVSSALRVGRLICTRAAAPTVDLVVVGQRRRPRLVERWVKSTTDTVLRHSSKPVLVVPDSYRNGPHD